ncbi:epidermal patterning factor 1 [Artemisia annua]|uniref:Epidermal patterning factor-like protein n=1 Tax=Artemisia annua TaxID=35608 RepID=A0A2U1LZI5_ARTAN|nr:epidermal patterning factor 1 [Artemisia annua]
MEMDNPDITMEEYISLEEEKALSNNRMIPAIVINDVISPEIAQGEELSQVFDLNENPAIVKKKLIHLKVFMMKMKMNVEQWYNEYSNIESFDYIVYDNILQLPQQKEKIRSGTDKPVEDGDSQDELESLTTKSGTNLFNIIDPFTNNLASFPKQKELKDELVDTTMIEEDGFNPMKDIEELELLLAKDPFSSFMEVKGRLTTNNTNEEERTFTHPKHTTLAHVMFKPSNLSTKSDHGHHHPTKAKPNYHGAIVSAPGKQRVDPVKVPGSRLPDCSHACGSCSPCRLVMVSFVCATIEEAETCPMAYKCMCNNKSYPVP